MNFCYFVEYREILRDAGLLPSFLRVEYCKAVNGFVNSDNETPVDVSQQPRIDHADIVLVNIPFPYTACYILDTELAAEFVRTASFKREQSRAVTEWEVRERAAMGLCHENVPESFQCRYVVPISKVTGTALNRAWISHLPNNYANDPKSTFGKLRMDALLVNARSAGAPSMSGAKRKTRRARWSNVDLYLVLPNKIIEGLRWRFGFKR